MSGGGYNLLLQEKGFLNSTCGLHLCIDLKSKPSDINLPKIKQTNRQVKDGK